MVMYAENFSWYVLNKVIKSAGFSDMVDNDDIKQDTGMLNK